MEYVRVGEAVYQRALIVRLDVLAKRQVRDRKVYPDALLLSYH